MTALWQRFLRAWAAFVREWYGVPHPSPVEAVRAMPSLAVETDRFRVCWKGDRTSGEFASASGGEARRYYEATQSMPGVTSAEFWQGEAKRGNWSRNQ